MRLIGMVFLALLCTGCQTDKMATASGSPEVTIANARPDQIKPAIVSAMLNTGLRIKADSQYNIVFEKREENLFVGVFFGTGYGPPVHRVSFAIAEVPGGTRVVADSAIIINPGTAFENRGVNVPEFPPARLQEMLDQIQSQVRSAATAPEVRPAQRKGG